MVAVPKYVELKQTIKRQIEDGQLKPNARVPSENELVRTFGVSNNTVQKAFTHLVLEGYITRIKGKGTFVAETDRMLRPEATAALFFPTEGHLFAELSRSLILQLQTLGYYALVFDPRSSGSTTEQASKLVTLLNSQIGAAIVDGISTFPFAVLHQRRKQIKSLIFLFHCETELEFSGAFKVLSDYEAGGRLVMDHLLNLGHKRILFYTHPSLYLPHFYTQALLTGCRAVLREKGIDPQNSLSIETHDVDQPDENRAKLTRILSARERPTAIFALGDFRARDIFLVARRLHLSIPGDLAVVGYYDTPWCEMFDVPLTSVSVELPRMARAMGAILAREPDANAASMERNVLIKPKLVIRSSCGAQPEKEPRDA